MRKTLIFAMLAVSSEAAIIGIESSGSCEVYTTTQSGSRIATLVSESYDRDAPAVGRMCMTPFGSAGGGAQTRFSVEANGDQLTLVDYSLANLRAFEGVANPGSLPADRIIVRSHFRFSYVETFETWLIVTGSTGRGELRGVGEGGLDRCCTEGLMAVADFTPGGTGPTATRLIRLNVPFIFGEPFRVTMRAGGFGETGSSAGLTSDAFSRSQFDSVFDAAGNRVFGAQIAVFEPPADQPVPEPATLGLLITATLTGAIWNFFRRLI